MCVIEIRGICEVLEMTKDDVVYVLTVISGRKGTYFLCRTLLHNVVVFNSIHTICFLFCKSQYL